MRIMRQRPSDVEGLRKLCECLTPGIAMVELGCFSGQSTRIFLESEKFTDIYCVDKWEFSPGKDYLEAEKVFDSWTSEFPSIHKFKFESGEGALQFKDRTLDLVYIDANHQYDHIHRDLELWEPKIKIPGWIGGHDYCWPYMGVVQAVCERYRMPRWVFCDSSWLVRLE